MIRILVVDDDKSLNQTVCTWLNDCGFQAIGVPDETERMFYAEEAVKSGWSVRQLQRQINIMY